MPEAFISMTTSPGPGVGSGKLFSSTLRSPRKTTPRMRLVLPRDLGLLAGGFAQCHRRRRAFAAPLPLVDALAEEIQLDGHVVRVFQENLEERRLRVREAAEVHLDLVTLDAFARLGGVLRQERDMVHRARAPGPLRMLLQQELVADLVWILRGQMDADPVARLEPVAGKAEVGPLGELEAENVLVEFLGALEVLGDEQEMVEFGDGHGSSVGTRYFAC